MTKDENIIMHSIDDESLKNVNGGVVLLPPQRTTTLEYLPDEDGTVNMHLPGKSGKSRVRTLEQKDIPLPCPPREI